MRVDESGHQSHSGKSTTFASAGALISPRSTVRSGTEGAGYADVGLKQSVQLGIIPGPRMVVVTRAIVATGSYGPKGYASEWTVPQGAEEADGIDGLTGWCVSKSAKVQTGSGVC